MIRRSWRSDKATSSPRRSTATSEFRLIGRMQIPDRCEALKGPSRCRLAARCIALTLLLGGVVAACGAATKAGQVVPAEHPLTAEEFAFLAYAGTLPSQQSLVSDADGLLKTRCMRAAGFRFYPGAPSPQLAAGLKATRLNTYSGTPPAETANLAAREKYGYGFSAPYSHAAQLSASGGPGAEFDVAYFHSLSRAAQLRFQTALTGSATAAQSVLRFRGVETTFSGSGCNASADDALYGSVRADLKAELVGEYAYGSVARDAQEDTRASVAKWSACMLSASGQRLAEPNAATQYVQRLYERYGDTARVRAQERSLATGDVRCQYKSGLAKDYAKTFRRLADELPVGLIKAIAWSDSLQQGAFRRASAILRKAGPRWRNGLTPPPGVALKGGGGNVAPVQIGHPSDAVAKLVSGF